ncbi:MAG: HDOD domain-containing protein [Ignavibacteriales bacterium]|nr:HDOD domain-containing protein [Ignavibacteriales bacterium]
MNVKVLFVAVLPDTIQEIEKIELTNKEIEFFFVRNNVEAINFVSRNDVDIVVTDFSTPRLNNSEFLSLLQTNFPKVFRVCLSTPFDKERTIFLAKSVHRFVNTPLDSNKLLVTITELGNLLKINLDAKLVSKINGIGAIPILPDIYQKLEREINKSSLSMIKIAEIIQRDPLVVARVLHIAHSSFFNIPSGVTDLLQAINFLGINIIKTLVLYVKIFSLSNVSEETKHRLKEIKAHSMNVAKLAKAIMEKESGDKEQIELAYISGLIHDIGKIVLLQLNDKQKQKTYFNCLHDFNSPEVEINLFGVSHINTGVYILKLWGFRDEIIDAVASHHDPSIIKGSAVSLNEAVFIANSFTNRFEDMSLNISKSFGLEKYNEWDQLLKSDERNTLQLEI